jgi:SAM-dependent methyltransferase
MEVSPSAVRRAERPVRGGPAPTGPPSPATLIYLGVGIGKLRRRRCTFEARAPSKQESDSLPVARGASFRGRGPVAGGVLQAGRLPAVVVVVDEIPRRAGFDRLPQRAQVASPAATSGAELPPPQLVLPAITTLARRLRSELQRSSRSAARRLAACGLGQCDLRPRSRTRALGPTLDARALCVGATASAAKAGPAIPLSRRADTLRLVSDLGLRLTRFHGFVKEHAPPPARLLEIGCGSGELARVLAADGYDVVAIDPAAPAEGIFRRATLEEFATEDTYDVVVASLSLHHVEDLDAAVDRIASLIAPTGRLVLQEWAKERLVDETAHWYHQRLLAHAVEHGDGDVPDSFVLWRRRTDENLADAHPFAHVQHALARRFQPTVVAWVPYLYSHALDDAVEPEERSLIESGAIAATGVLYVGRWVEEAAA